MFVSLYTFITDLSFSFDYLTDVQLQNVHISTQQQEKK